MTHRLTRRRSIDKVGSTGTLVVLPYDSISRSIAARHLLTPLKGSTLVSVKATPSQVIRRLAPKKYDQAPVVAGGVVVGVVTLTDAQAAQRDAMPLPVQPLASRFLVSADASVATLLRRLASVPMVFAVEDDGLTGFVTPSDLNKHPARSHFYLLLADFEMTMAVAARRHFRDATEALGLLKPNRRKPIEKRYEANRSFNVDADVLTAFEFADLITVIGRVGLFKKFGIRSSHAWDAVTEPLPKFRNAVMHPTREFLGSRTISDLLVTEQRLRKMLTASRYGVAA